ncbi:hypothetical protein U9M48_041327 [Paspalum notatum var. saurae]|uniref:Uncharacterized protein n=1 Tax=Paspalum notatum var. saurae TaxID=547442 RepID=A0AAQ3UN19_PASNO
MTGGVQVAAYQLILLVLSSSSLLPLLLRLLASSSTSRRRCRHGSNCNDSNDGDKQQQQQLLLPPSPPGRLPINGHLHLVGSLPHVSLRDLASCSSTSAPPPTWWSAPRAPPRPSSARTTTSSRRGPRPGSPTAGLVYGSSGVAFSPYGHHWRQVRKLVTTHLLTLKKVHSYRCARREEVSLVIAKIREAVAAGVAVDMSAAMNTFSNDIISRAVSGKFFRAEGRNKLFRELVKTNSNLFGGFNLEEYLPGLVDSLGFLCRWFRLGNNRAVDAHHKRWDELLETVVSDHERRNSSLHRHGRAGDFTDVLLSVYQEYGITRDHVKAILMGMFAAGTGTSSLVLEFAMAELMRNPQCRTKLQDEIRENTPEGQEMVEEENLGSMPYLRAVVKETLRLHPPSWEKPEEFMPERFMDGGNAAGVDFRGNDFQFLPFGAGRRICPGINFGLATVEIMLANLMYCFDWQLPVGMEEKDVDMTEVFGLTMHLKETLMLVPKLP